VKHAVLAFATLSACAPLPKTAVSSAWPAAPAARELLPIDLDFVLRVDTERLRAMQAFSSVALERARQAAPPGLARDLWPLLEQSSALVFGGRTFADGFHGDGVLVIEGGREEKQLVAAEPPFVAVESPRSDVRLFERSLDARDEPVLEANCGKGGIALATAAEADSVLRVVRDGPDRGRLEPRAHGVLSFIGRTSPSLDANDAKPNSWKKLGRGLRNYEGSVEFAAGIEAAVDLEYGTTDDATEATSVVRQLVARLGLQMGPLKTLADSVRLSPREQTLGVRFDVPLELLAVVDWSALSKAVRSESAVQAEDGGSPAAP
jgi:hypothetical protein